jgi:hypothetical protein
MGEDKNLPLLRRAENCAKDAYPWQRGHPGRPFQPGQSGNPGGLPRFYYEARKLARQAAPDVMQELIRLALSAQDERVRSVCAVAVLDRAGIRPVDFDPNEQFAHIDSMTLEERKRRLAELTVKSLAMLGMDPKAAATAAGAEALATLGIDPKVVATAAGVEIPTEDDATT